MDQLKKWDLPKDTRSFLITLPSYRNELARIATHIMHAIPIAPLAMLIAEYRGGRHYEIMLFPTHEYIHILFKWARDIRHVAEYNMTGQFILRQTLLGMVNYKEYKLPMLSYEMCRATIDRLNKFPLETYLIYDSSYELICELWPDEVQTKKNATY
jgi:hypothetical protein